MSSMDAFDQEEHDYWERQRYLEWAENQREAHVPDDENHCVECGEPLGLDLAKHQAEVSSEEAYSEYWEDRMDKMIEEAEWRRGCGR